MKKSLFALAATTAIAGAAQAQSSVTVYGILDMGYVGSNTRSTASQNTTSGGSATAAATKANYNGFNGLGAEQSSRIGFRGVEDLGSGASAFFTIEMRLDPQNASNAITTNRQTFVGLKKNGIGALSTGYQYTPVFNTSAVTDPGQHNGTIGNVIYVSNNNSTASALAGNTNATGAFTNSAANSLFAKTDSFAGFTASAMYQLNNRNQTETAYPIASTTSGGYNNVNGWGLSADYTWKKLYVGVAYQSFKANSPGTIASAVPGLTGTYSNNGTTFTAATALTNAVDNQTLAGTTYDFGILKAYAQYVNRKATSTNTTNYVSRTAQQIGVRSYITPVIESWASVGNGRYTSYGNGIPTINFTGYQVGSNYYLSKRTNLYAIFGSMQSSSSSTVVDAGSAGNQYAVGIRHTF